MSQETTTNNFNDSASEEEDDDDASDEGERIRNVRSLLIKPKNGRQQESDENYAYKRKLGDLIFDAHFEGGNLGSVEQIDQSEYDLMVRPDVCNPRHRIWFNFRISNQRVDQCVILTLVNLSENLTLFNEGLTPVVRSQSHPNWWRIDGDQAFYYKSAPHRNRPVLSMAFRFATADDEHQFALFYPYTFTTLSNFLNRWQVELKRRHYSRRQRHLSASSSRQVIVGPAGTSSNSQRDNEARLSIETLTHSILNLPIYLVTITPESSPSAAIVAAEELLGSPPPPRPLPPPPPKPLVILLGRMGGNFESIVSVVCQGALDFLLSDDILARTARDHFELVCLPMLDPDSIWAGNGRTDLMGQLAPVSGRVVSANQSLYRNYELAKKRLINLTSLDDRRQVSRRTVVIQLRVNQNLIGSRTIGAHYVDSLRMERHCRLPRLLARFADGFYLEKCEFQPLSVTPNSLVDLRSKSNVDQYQLEVSPFAHFKRSLLERQYERYDQRKYLLLGKSVVYSLLDLFRSKNGTLQALPREVAHTLDSFHLGSNDVDDLILENSYS